MTNFHDDPFEDEIRPANNNAERLIDYDDMNPRLDGCPLVRGILERQQISVLFGEAGCGKTFLALDLALHLAAGRDWFGRRVQQGPVIYLAAEAGRSIINRVAAWRQTTGLAGLPFAARATELDLCHRDSGDLDRLLDQLRERKPVFVVIDTVSRILAGGNENAPDDMGAVINAFGRLRDELECHVLAVHHAGKDTGKGARGHSLLHCGVDTEIEIRRDKPSGVSTAMVVKQRDGIAGDHLVFRLRQVELGRDREGEPVTSCVVEPLDKVDQSAAKDANQNLAPAHKIALKALVEAVARAGEVPPPSEHIPAGVACVPEDLWRQYCYDSGISAGESQDAQRKAFTRSTTALIAAGRIGSWQRWCWPSNLPDRTR
jgi:KaiC/GvpD/RAD55 family RecA-like ATPase